MNEMNLDIVDDYVWSEVCSLAPAALNVDETGLSKSFISELICKHIYIHGVLDLREMYIHIGLEWNVLEEVLSSLKTEAIVEIKGPASNPSGLRYTLTDKGILFAKNAMKKDGYVGIAPVTVSDYNNIVYAQNVHSEIIDRSKLDKTFTDVIVG